MLKNLFCRLPQVKQFNNYKANLTTIKVVLTSLLLAKQFAFKSRWGKVFKTATISFFIAVFLVVIPSTTVQANFNEKVIPARSQKAVLEIKDRITAVALPSFQAPLYTNYISTRFSFFHQGIDLPNSVGTPVRAIADGVVTFAGWSNLGYGKLITIRHNGSYESLYAHLSVINVKIGERVTSQTIIGAVGATGRATGNHLHIEVHLNGVALDPLRFFSPLK